MTRYRISFDVESAANAAGILNYARALLENHTTDVNSIRADIVPSVSRFGSLDAPRVSAGAHAAAVARRVWTRMERGWATDGWATEMSDLFGPLRDQTRASAFTFTCPADMGHVHSLRDMTPQRDREGDVREWVHVCGETNQMLRIFND